MKWASQSTMLISAQHLVGTHRLGHGHRIPLVVTLGPRHDSVKILAPQIG